MVLTDREFFEKAINYDYPGFKEIQKYSELCDFATCRRLLAEAVRMIFNPKPYFSVHPEKYNAEAVIERAEKACRHYMESVCIPMDFKGGPIDWFANPTENGYKEWTWQLSRHAELVTLAKAYLATKEVRYKDAAAEILNSWFEAADAPAIGTSGYDTMCWRTIECGIRAGWNWPIVINTFVPVWDDDTVCNLCKSIYEHGMRLRNDYTTGNWLIMEMNGLCHIGVFFPFLKDSCEWYDFAMKMLDAELSLQLYPDKAQYELTPNYQGVIITNYLLAIKTARAYGKTVPDSMLKAIERACEYYIHIMTPDRRIISTNDGNHFKRDHVPTLLSEYAKEFPDNPAFKWLYGEEGGIEPCKDYIFDYAGFASLRTDWSENAVMVFFDGGPFGRAHQHEDKLALSLWADGKEILPDPGGYAYDDSPMRHHILDTFSHNTAAVDGMAQSRRRNYVWHNEDIKIKSGLKYKLGDEVDVLSALYDEGYGSEGMSDVTHKRNIYFLKKCGTLRPFVIVVDRFTALDEKSHNYDVMWHIDAESLTSKGLFVHADTLRISVSRTPSLNSGLEVCYGRTFPTLQGWYANSMKQGDFRPIYAATYKLCEKSTRLVTVLYPDGGDNTGVCRVSAVSGLCDTEIRFYDDSGKEYIFDEKDYIPE